ncbi:MAG: MerR family transcriptional regulator [Anaerolineae bacterium]|nr:MerR family transcriptional regulator [Anaerolineae bacterium]
MEELTIGEVARLAGLQTSALRYYESIGLLPPPRRVSGQRRYAPTILQLLAVIQLAKDANFTLPEIHELLYGNGGQTPAERWQNLAYHKIRELDDIIAEAQEKRALLIEGTQCDALQFELDGLNLPTKSEKAS